MTISGALTGDAYLTGEAVSSKVMRYKNVPHDSPLEINPIRVPSQINALPFVSWPFNP